MAFDRHQIALRVTEHGYEPCDEAGRKQHAKLKVGSLVGARVARSRSVVQNALYWRVLQAVVDSTGQWRTPEELHLALKVACGYVDVVRLTNGRMIKVPGSTSFDALDQDGFQRYCDAAFRIICDEIMGGMSIEELLNEAQAA